MAEFQSVESDLLALEPLSHVSNLRVRGEYDYRYVNLCFPHGLLRVNHSYKVKSQVFHPVERLGVDWAYETE